MNILDNINLKESKVEIDGKAKYVYDRADVDEVLGLLKKELREEKEYNGPYKNTFQIGKNVLQAETNASPEVIAKGHLHYIIEGLLGNTLNKVIDEISKSVAGDIRFLHSSIEIQPFLIQLFISENTIKKFKNEIIWSISTKDRKFRKYLKNDAELEKLGFKKG